MQPHHPPSPRARPSPSGPVVIGLAGGIGSGKSAVAAIMGRRGASVQDADAQVRAALATDAVRATLVEWWGAGALRPDGSVDRARVGQIVFADPAQRRRLETLLHPIVIAEQKAAISHAAAAGTPAVVIDAPLLFEAGADRLCHATVFVECPREIRLERVARTRAWDTAELVRREAVQIPLDEKRRRCGYLIMNDAGTAELEDRTGRVYDQILLDHPAGRR